MKNRKRGKEANQRNNGMIASILTNLWFFTLILIIDLARAMSTQQNLLVTNDYNQNKKMVKQKFNYLKILAGIITLLVLMPQIFAADPGHAASSISEGQFESGNYTFPDSLHIDKFLNVTGLLYVDPLTNKVGIGTTSPTQELNVIGDLNVTEGLNLSMYTSCTALETDASGNLLCGSDEGVGASGVDQWGWTNITGLVYTTQSSDLVHIGGNVSMADNLTVGGDKFYVDSSSGNVGIGTTNPTPYARFYVAPSGGYDIRSDIMRVDTYLITYRIMGITTLGIDTDGNNPITIGDSSTGNVILNPGGNVGIGTTSPTQELNVIGDLNVTEGLNLSMYTTCTALETDSSGNLLCGSDADTGATLGTDQWGWTNASGVVYTTQLTDKVGIGTTAPTQELNVVGDLNVTEGLNLSMYTTCTALETDSSGNLLCGSDADSGIGNDLAYDPTNIAFLNETVLNSTYFRLVDDGTIFNATFAFNTSLDQYVARNDWTQHDNYPAACAAGQYATQIGDTLTCLPSTQWGWTNASGVVYTTQLTDKVGIGTTSPTQKLNVIGDLNVTEGLNLSMYTACTALETDSSGNLLCGSDADTGATLGKDQWGWTNITGLVYTTQSADLVHIGGNVSMADNLTVGGDKLYVDSSSGRVGIGDTTPDYLLDVAGTLGVDGVITAGSTPVALTGATGYILETAITQDSLDDSEIEDNSLTVLSLGVDSVSDSELDGGFGWTLDTDLNIDSDTLVVSQDDDRVGIGTAIPTHTFSVVGTMNVTRAAGAAGGIEVDSSGNVIIRLG